MINKIDIFPWNHNFNTGIEDIDKQHKTLVSLLNLMVSHLMFHTDAIEINSVFKQLKEYAIVHFKTEEEIWSTCLGQDQWAIGHHKAHNHFVDEILKIKAEEERKPFDDVIEEIVSFLTHWLALHILEADKRMAKTIFAVQSGASLEEAKTIANEQMSGATKMMIETVMSMYDNLAVRTVQLSREISRRKAVEIRLKYILDELYAAKEAAEIANRFKNAFLNNMSYELRTPINTIMGVAHLVSNTELNPIQQDYINKMQSAGRALLNIIDDMFDFSKMENGRMDIEDKPFNLENLFSDMSSSIKEKAAEKGLELIFDIDRRIPLTLRGDAEQIRQILIKYVSNALKYTFKGKISISAQLIENTAAGLLLRFAVQDTGIGLTEEQQKNIFCFLQSDESLQTTKCPDAMFGLAICKKLAELMGGEVGVDSETGVGSSFWFTLRLQTDGVQSTKQDQLSDVCRFRILVVDDNEKARDIICAMLATMSCDASAVASGLSAIREVISAAGENRPYNFVFMACHMPMLDGPETAKHIKGLNLRPAPEIILITEYDISGTMEQVHELGITKVLTKPLTPFMLFDSIITLSGEKLPDKDSIIRELKIKEPCILLVYDDDTNRDIAVTALNEAGYRADTAANGQEALDMLTVKKYALVLMDMSMMDEITAVKAIRKNVHLKDMPIAAMIANVEQIEKDNCIEAGINGFITKPLEPEKMKHEIGRLLDSSSVPLVYCNPLGKRSDL